MKKLLPLFLSFLLGFSIVIVQISCSEKGQTDLSVNPEESISLQKKPSKRFVNIENYADSISIDSLQAVTEAMQCGYYQVDGYQFHHFEVKPGKSIGIMPAIGRINLSDLEELYDDYCFRYYVHRNGDFEDEFDDAILAGFNRDKIMVQSTMNGYQNSRVDLYGEVYAYYIDEPIYHDWEYWQFSALKNHIENIANSGNGYNSKLITGDWVICTDFNNIVSICDNVMYSVYKEFIQFYDCVWTDVVGTDDQRGNWTAYKNTYGGKNSMAWISQHTDYVEYNSLFSHAKSLGYNIVWNYQRDGDVPSYFWEWVSAAWYNGYLRRFSEKVTFEYKCYNQTTPCDCDENDPDDWYLNRIIPWGQIVEDFPAQN